MRKAVLILMLLAVTTLGWACGEAGCQADGGRVVVHTLTGNKWCDMPPYLGPDEGLFDLDGRDYLID